jgi:hypothetical protein
MTMNMQVKIWLVLIFKIKEHKDELIVILIDPKLQKQRKHKLWDFKKKDSSNLKVLVSHPAIFLNQLEQMELFNHMEIY